MFQIVIKIFNGDLFLNLIPQIIQITIWIFIDWNLAKAANTVPIKFDRDETIEKFIFAGNLKWIRLRENWMFYMWIKHLTRPRKQCVIGNNVTKRYGSGDTRTTI